MTFQSWKWIVFLLWGVFLAQGCSPEDSRPNIVFILIDDLGWSDVGCYGNQFNDTPNIDRLASEGMRFTDAYAAAPVCSPTRASIVSGQYPARLGVTDFIRGHWRPYEILRVPINRTQYLPLEVRTLAEALTPAGYVSGYFGKWHLGGTEYFPDKQGFGHSLVSSGWGHFFPTVRTSPPIETGDGDYLAEVLTDQAIDFLEQNRDHPFLLYLSHFAVHLPLEARQELIAKYEGRPRPQDGIHNPVYAAMVEHVDWSVGRILQKLSELDLARETIVVFFSDNGGLTRRFDGEGGAITTNDPLRDEKGTLYEGGIRVPLIVRWPGRIEAGSLCGVPVSSVDFYPTFLSVAGLPVPANTLDGESLVPLLTQSGMLAREALYWHYPHYHHSVPASAVRVANWKLIEFFGEGRIELYDLAHDIGESENLADENPGKAQELKLQLDDWRKSVVADLPVENPDFDPARRQLWGRLPRN